MGDLEFELAGCTGKERFRTYGAADRVNKRQAKVNRQFRKRDVYRCKTCSGYHLGTRSPEMPKQALFRYFDQRRKREAHAV